MAESTRFMSRPRNRSAVRHTVGCMSTLTISLCQILLTFSVAGEGPVRFGFPLRPSDLERGLRVDRVGAQLQWRLLQERPDPLSGRVWVELSLTGATGTLRLKTGRQRGTGPVVERETTVAEEDGRRVERTMWRWRTGERDEVTRTTFHREHVDQEGEVFGAGESLTEVSDGFDGRWLRVGIPRRAWETVGMLPRDRGLGRDYRQHLVQIAGRMRELPGVRGRGDYGRSGDVVTNLEFDTTLGLGRLGLAMESSALLERAGRSARHMLDRDLDMQTGLTFRHGPGHRVVPAEPGHVWLQGLLLVGCLSADDGLIRGAETIARGLARHPRPEGERVDRARDLGWPLLEMEAWLRFAADPVLARAADRTMRAILGRFDDRADVFRFGEGELRSGAYEDRAWITGGILVPALRAHRLRRPAPGLAKLVNRVEERLAALVLSGRKGLPVRYVIGSGSNGRSSIGRQVRQTEVPEAYLLLEGLSPKDLARCLDRSTVERALGLLPLEDDPDLATSFSKVARCWWVLR